MRMRVGGVGVAAVMAMSAGAMADYLPGDLVVSMVGDGTTALSGAAFAWQLQEFSPAGSLTGPALNLNAITPVGHSFTGSGSATSEGFLTLSADGRYLTMGGYDATVGTAAVAGTTSAANPRIAARVAFNGTGDFSTMLSDAYSGGNIRSVVSSNGTDLWTGGSTGGVRYAPIGSTTSTVVSSTVSNNRVVNIFGGNLFLSTGSGTRGIYTLGALPTGSGVVATNVIATGSASSPYDFVFTDASTCYIADDSALTAGGGLQKWTLSGGVWGLAYTMNSGLTAGLRGLTATVDPASGRTLLYATTADAVNANAGNKLVSVMDGGAGSPFTTLYTAPGNVALRGVDFAPVPTPGSAALLGLGMLAAARRRR